MIVVRGLRYSERFARELKSAPPDIQRAALAALRSLQETPVPRGLRLHALTGLPKPTLWKIDVTANHAWQITLEMDDGIAILKRLARHKSIDRKPR